MAIQYIDYFIPEGRIGIDDIFSEASAASKMPPAFSTPQEGADFFKSTLALEMVSCSQGLTEEQMLGSLLTKMIDAKIVDCKDIDLIISIGDDQGNSQRMLNPGHYIQFKYGFVHADVMAFSGNHCANTEYAIVLAEGLLKCGKANHILVINASIFRSHADRIVGTYGVHGDAAGIVYLNNVINDGISITGHHSYTNGILYKADVNEKMLSLVLCKNYLTCLSGFIRKFSIQPEDIVAIIVQNANYHLVSQCLQSLGFMPKLLFLENISKYGHLDSIDFIVNLKSIMESNYQEGTNFISFGAGWAGSNCCLFMQKR